MHIGTNVYIVEVEFQSEQKMLAESLDPAFTQKKKDVYHPGDCENDPSSFSHRFKVPPLGNTNIFSFSFPSLFFLLHFLITADFDY